MRLDTYIAISLSIKRRVARTHIAGGVVRVDARTVLYPDWQVFLDFERVEVEGRELKTPMPHRMLMMNKPPGVVTESGLRTACPQPCVTDLIPEQYCKPPPAIYGRLDRDTSGLLLFGTDGAITDNLLHPLKHVDKVYLVTTAEPLPESAVQVFRQGVVLGGGAVCRPAELVLDATDPCTFRLTIHEGMFHQVKKMVGAVGGYVTKLHREQMGGLLLDPTLPQGQVRPLTTEELRLVQAMLPADRRCPRVWRKDSEWATQMKKRKQHPGDEEGKEGEEGNSESELAGVVNTKVESSKSKSSSSNSSSSKNTNNNTGASDETREALPEEVSVVS